MVQFLKDAREFGVTMCYAPTCLIALLGFLGWTIPLVFYSVLLFRSRDDDLISNIWIVDICLHIFSGVLTDIDAYFYNGRFWPLRAFIVGSNSFITFTLPGLFGYYLSVNEDTSAVLVLIATACTCLMNASLVAIALELFQKRQTR